MGYKYVMIQVGQKSGMTVDFPIIFPDKLNHDDVANAIGVVCSTTFKLPVKVVSAGFIPVLAVTAAEGRSETLNLESDPVDKDVIMHLPYLHGIDVIRGRPVEKPALRKPTKSKKPVRLR